MEAANNWMLASVSPNVSDQSQVNSNLCRDKHKAVSLYAISVSYRWHGQVTQSIGVHCSNARYGDLLASETQWVIMSI